MLKVIKDNFLELLFDNIKNIDYFRIMSPYVTHPVVNKLVSCFNGDKIKLITRFNLDDYFAGVSDLKALSLLLESSSHIKGIRGLHAKIFLFGNNSALVSSSNFTKGGMYKNHEIGLFTDNRDVVRELVSYFENMWGNAGKELNNDQITKWEEKITNARVTNSILKHSSLGDFGMDLSQTTDDSVFDDIGKIKNEIRISESIQSDRKYYVKFLGNSNSRGSRKDRIQEVVKNSECHYAVTHKKHPRKIKTGDIVFIAYIISEPNDYSIFGKAFGIEHVDQRDVATEEERERTKTRMSPPYRWKDEWPYYTRIYDPYFLDGTLEDGVMLYEDIDSVLGYKTLMSTYINYSKQNRKNVETKGGLKQHSYIEITEEAAVLIEETLRNKIKQLGSIPQYFIENLPQSNILIEK